MVNIKKRAGRLLAVLGAVALSVGGVTAANAAEFGGIDPEMDGKGSITITKLSGLPDPAINLSIPMTPGPPDPVSNTPLYGVEFTIWEVLYNGNAIDLTTPEGWDQAYAAFKNGEAPTGPYTLRKAQTVTTNCAGEAYATNLNLTLYYVEETSPGANNIVRPVQPFYVIIPMPPKKQGDPWLYDVVVKPKNQLIETPTKKIEETTEDDTLVLGDKVKWTIDAPIPDITSDDKFDSASVYDQLDSRLAYSSSKVTLVSSAGVEVDLVPGTHYTLSDSNQTVVWKFTEEGLKALKANKGGKIVVELVTTVHTLGNGTIENKPGPLGNGYGSEFNDKPTDGDKTPVTYWGEFAILKVDRSTPAKVLKGAEFSLTETNADQTCPYPLSNEVVATGESDGNGVVQWTDKNNTKTGSPIELFVGNFDEAQTPLPSKKYCLYETKAPAGYVASDAGKVVEVAAGKLTEGTFSYEIDNGIVPYEPHLPKTGAVGTVVLAILGIALVGGGAVLATRGRRRDTNA